jgi:hypothetical protein
LPADKGEKTPETDFWQRKKTDWIKKGYEKAGMSTSDWKPALYSMTQEKLGFWASRQG